MNQLSAILGYAECAACRADFPPVKLGKCPDCGRRFCGDHILDHKCPPTTGAI